MSQLDFAPQFTLIRSIAGALAVDSVVNDTNFPPYAAHSINSRFNKILVYWTATGAAQLDAIDLRVLARDATENKWLTGPVIQNIPPDTPIEIEVNKIGMFTLRIEAVNAHAGITATKLYAALGSN